jgi:hypothetical protein
MSSSIIFRPGSLNIRFVIDYHKSSMLLPPASLRSLRDLQVALSRNNDFVFSNTKPQLLPQQIFGKAENC